MQTFVYIVLMLCDCAADAATARPLAFHTQMLDYRGEQWEIRLPDGLELEILTTEPDGPRLMTFLPNGDLLIGSRSGNLYRLTALYRHPQVLVRLPGYRHSLAYRDGELLIARTDGLYAAPYRPGQDSIAVNTIKRLAALPEDGGHNQPQRDHRPRPACLCGARQQRQLQ